MSGLTPARRWLRTSRGGHVALLAGLVAAWLVLYRINESLWEAVLFGWLGLAPEQRLGETLRFFLYDAVKIALLLSGIIFVVTVLRSNLSLERTRALLAGRREGIGNVLAALLGVITPFCSCSAVPAFIGFLAAGIPLGVTMSFLIASPMVNEVAIGLLFNLFGWRITLIYISSGLLIAILAGWVLGRLQVERWVESFG
ncbi:MAG: permease [Cyanobium sp. CZS 25K]|nr:permease [Cyanobium sp. CZS25K]